MSALEAALADAAKSGIRFDRIPLNGIRMHYARKGPPDAPKLLLLHGWPEFWMLWRPLFDRLSNEFDLIAPDLRGFGDTGKAQTGPDPGVTAVAHAEDIRAFVDALGLSRFGLVAGDVGSYVAQAYSRRHGERIAGLVSFNSPYPGFGARYGAPGHLIEVWYRYFNQLPWAAGVIGATREVLSRLSQALSGSLVRRQPRCVRRCARDLGRQLHEAGQHPRWFRLVSELGADPSPLARGAPAAGAADHGADTHAGGSATRSPRSNGRTDLANISLTTRLISLMRATTCRSSYPIWPPLKSESSSPVAWHRLSARATTMSRKQGSIDQ